MKKKDYFKLRLISFATWGCLMPLRGYYVGLYGATIILTIAFALLTWWAMKKYAPKAGFWRVLIPLLAPWLFVELASRLLEFIFIRENFYSSLFSMPTSVMPLFAVITIAIFYRYRKKWLFAILGALCVFGITEGHKQWVEWVVFGDYPTLSVNLADCEVTDSTHTFKLSDVESEYLVLDVWSSGCGYCIRQLPEIQELHDEYKGSNIEVVSLFACYRKGETFNDGYEIMKERNCNFPMFAVGEKDDPILTRCEISRYPRVLILDKNRTVIFNGSLEFAKRKMKRL
jgi:thiol-disulfide isomerase/thioredoxin